MHNPPKCTHHKKDTVVVFIKTHVDHRLVPRFKCKNCGRIGNVIYKVNPNTGNVTI